MHVFVLRISLKNPMSENLLGLKKSALKKNQAQNNFPPRNEYKVTDLLISSIEVFSDYINFWFV